MEPILAAGSCLLPGNYSYYRQLAVIYSVIEQKDFLKLNHRNIFLVAKNAAIRNFGRMCVRTLINLTAIGQNLGQICDIDASIMLICVSKPHHTHTETSALATGINLNWQNWKRKLLFGGSGHETWQGLEKGPVLLCVELSWSETKGPEQRRELLHICIHSPHSPHSHICLPKKNRSQFHVCFWEERQPSYLTSPDHDGALWQSWGLGQLAIINSIAEDILLFNFPSFSSQNGRLKCKWWHMPYQCGRE